jgi:hypothetical protein
VIDKLITWIALHVFLPPLGPSTEAWYFAALLFGQLVRHVQEPGEPGVIHLMKTAYLS